MSIPILVHKNTHLANDKMAFIMAINVGSNSDGNNRGIAHLLEHVLLGFDRFQCEKELENYEIVGKTSFETTTYTLTTCDIKENVEKCFRILSAILNGVYIREFGYNVIKNDVIQEIHESQKSIQKSFYLRLFKHLYVDSDNLMNFPIGTIDCVRNITYRDICNFWDKTYKIASYRIAVMSEVETGFIKEKYDIYFKNAYYKPINSYMPSMISNELYTWDFGEGIGIYIKLKEMDFYNKTIKNRVIEDMGCILIEEFMPQYICDNIVVHCHKFRYSKSEQFLSIELYIEDKQAKRAFICSKTKEWLQEFLKFMLNNCKKEQFILLKEEYINFINHYVPTTKEQIDDMTNSIIYGDALFDNGGYKENLLNVNIDDLYEKILSWFKIT